MTPKDAASTTRDLGVVLFASVVGIAPALGCVDAGLGASRDAGPAPDASVDSEAGSPSDVGPAADAWRGPDAGPPEDLQGAVEFWMNAGGLHGVAALARQGDTRLVVLAGTRDDVMPVTEHTLFNVASISKTVVGALALQLAEEERLDLDAPVDGVLGFAVRHPDAPEVAITPRMLMTHTSGLVDDFLDLAAFTSDGDPTIDLDTFARDWVADPAHWGARPGTQRVYCNACFGVLGRVLERASGSDLRTSTAQRLEAPLALDGAGWFYEDVDTTRLALPYTYGARGYAPLALTGFAHYPAGMWMTSLVGIERWLGGFVDNGIVDGVRFLDVASVDETRRVQLPALDDGQALVWSYVGFDGATWLGHSGAGVGSSAQMRYRPSDGRMLVVLTNSDAYIRSRLGLEAGSDAIERILERLDRALDAL